ncbi:MAG: recombination protein NinG [Colwellia sp.]|jgi:Bacteriophage Lambda NinG protein.
MARCGIASCKKKYDLTGRGSTFDNWCSDACKAEIIAGRIIKQKSRPAKSSSFSTKTRKQLKTKTTLQGAALGSREHIKKKKERAVKLEIKRDSSALVIFQAETTLKAVKNRAKSICHLYIRTRDKGKLCACCNRPLGETFHAGHFMESANNTAIRFDETNIHGQREDCNIMHGGDFGSFDKNLRIRIGDDAVERLIRIAKRRVVAKLALDDYLEIIEHYKTKLEVLIKSQTFEVA